MNPYVVVLALYSGGLIGFGLWISRRVHGPTDFFVAGRSLGPGLLFSTVLAANIGAGSTVVAAGLGYRDGLSAWWWVGSAGIGSLLLAFWVGPRVRALAERHGFYTVGDLLAFRYGRAARGTMAALLWVGTLAILASQLVVLGFVLEVVADLPKWVSVGLGGIVMTTYFTAGGLVGAAWINLVQLVVLLGAFALAVPIAIAGVGGWGEFLSRTATLAPGYHDIVTGGQSGWKLLPLVAPNFIISPGLVQKVYGGRNARAVQVGVGLAAVVLFLFAFAPTILGMVARMHYPDLAGQEYALPTLFRHNVPVLIGAIGLGAIFMADISSADAILFMLATSMSQDLYKQFVRPEASEREVLRVARGSAVAGGVVAMGLALVAETALGPLSIFYSLVGVILFVPVVAALYTGRAGAPEAFASFLAGVAVMLTARVVTDGAGIGALTPNILGLLASALGFGLVMLARRGARAGPGGPRSLT